MWSRERPVAPTKYNELKFREKRGEGGLLLVVARGRGREEGGGRAGGPGGRLTCLVSAAARPVAPVVRVKLVGPVVPGGLVGRARGVEGVRSVVSGGAGGSIVTHTVSHLRLVRSRNRPGLAGPGSTPRRVVGGSRVRGNPGWLVQPSRAGHPPAPGLSRSGRGASCARAGGIASSSSKGPASLAFLLRHAPHGKTARGWRVDGRLDAGASCPGASASPGGVTTSPFPRRLGVY